MSKKLYSEKQVAISAVIGGPIPAGILFFLNYKNIGKVREGYVALAITAIFTIGLFYTLMILPEEILSKVPNMLFTAAYGLIVYFFYKKLLSTEINLRLDNEFSKGSNWTVAGITLLGTIISLAIILTMATSMPPYEGDKMTFGANEVYYDPSETSEADVRMLADVLMSSGFFNDEFPTTAFLKSSGNECVVTLAINKDVWSDPEVLEFMHDLKSQLTGRFDKDVTIIMEDYDLSGKRFEKRI